MSAALPAGAGFVASPRRGMVLYVAAMACFSLSDVMAQRLSATLAVPQVVWGRYVVLALSLVLLRLLAPPQATARAAPPRQAGLQLLRGLALLASALLFNLGLAALPLATATALVFSSPLFVTLLSVWVLRERVAGARWGWVLLGFAGVLVVARPDPASFDGAVLWPVGSSAAWAVAMIATRHLAGSAAPATTQAWSCACGLLLCSLLLPGYGRWPDTAQAAELLAMGACWAGAQWLVLLAYRHAAASTIAPFAYSQMLWAHALAVLLLAQWPAPTTLLGSAVILAAGWGAARTRHA